MLSGRGVDTAGEEKVNIAAWLEALGLQQYEQAFRDNAIDDGVLPELTAEDLRDIGVGLVGHRRKLLAAIAALRNDGRAESTAEHREVAHTAAARRQLTVMFCDLVGSTALSAQLDPEDLREIMATYHGTISEIVNASYGLIARYMGDGVLAYFGYPRAHEDDAEQAIRAGLGLVDAVRRLDVGPIKLQARVGIATGVVVIGDLIGEGAAQEQSVIGETPNVAARLQALAEPSSVVVAASTRRLVGNFFEFRDLGFFEVKGIAAPVPAWQVIRPRDATSRFEALHGSILSPLIGRKEEIELLLRRWERAKAGNGQVVFLSGEPGIGKSRIIAELEKRLQVEPHLRLRFSCSAYYADSALFPFIEQLSRASGFASEDPPAVKLEKLNAVLARAAPSDEDVACLADLLGLPTSERYPLPNLSPRRKKERTLEALVRQLEGSARRQPMVVVFEDAHWMDPTSRELLDLTIERVRCLPVLLLVTFRPGFQPPRLGEPQVTMVALNRLDQRDRTALVEQIAGGKRLPNEVVHQIADRTDGVPLFVEELTKSVIESGILREEAGRYVLGRTLRPFEIPTTLQDSLMARLDRLESVRLVAQIGAAIGREFSYALLHAVSRLPADELEAALDRLVVSELVFQRGAPPDAVYRFKHALVQDTAYSSLLRTSRQQMHVQIAEALETQFPELMEIQPELFAQHYAEAGFVEKSVDYWYRAGRRSAARSAMAEAVAQLQKGLDQLSLLPDNRKRQEQELEFWSALGAALRFAKGQASPDMGHAFARGRELWEQLGYPSEFLHIPYGQSFYHNSRGEFDLAQRLDEDLLRLSRQHNDVAGLVLGHLSSGRNMLNAGQFASSRSHLEEVIKLYDPIAHIALGYQTGSDPRVGARGQLGIALFCLGFPDQGLAQINAGITEASTLAHPPSLAASLAMGCRFLSLVDDYVALDERTDELIAVAAEQGFPVYEALGTIYRGWYKIRTGDVAEGISLLRSGSSAFLVTGTETRISYYIALLARGCDNAGQVDETLSLLNNALQIAATMGERWFAAELFRQKGELILRQGHSAVAEELFRQALNIAREQEARLWELRAAVSLARLFGERGRHSEAHDCLAPVYGWFTEGSCTPDLKRAKALLDGLNDGDC
jgi:class 3 adenylate cyclase/predicted ATPase